MLCSMLGLEEITFTYYGMRNQKFDVAAVCQTEGGPEQLRFSSGKPGCGVIFLKHFFWVFSNWNDCFYQPKCVCKTFKSQTHTIILHFDKSSLQSLIFVNDSHYSFCTIFHDNELSRHSCEIKSPHYFKNPTAPKKLEVCKSQLPESDPYLGEVFCVSQSVGEKELCFNPFKKEHLCLRNAVEYRCYIMRFLKNTFKG